MPANLQVLRDHLKKVPVNEANGIKFYEHMFTVAPDLRAFFKGAENIKVSEIATSPRFIRQGQRLLLSMHVIVELADKPDYESFVREMLDKHLRLKVPYELFVAFFDVWYSYLAKITGMSDEQKREWTLFQNETMLPAIKRNFNGWLGGREE